MNARRAKKGEAAATETVLRGVDGFAAASPLRVTGGGWRVGVWQPGRPLRETNGVASRLPDPLRVAGVGGGRRRARQRRWRAFCVAWMVSRLPRPYGWYLTVYICHPFQHGIQVLPIFRPSRRVIADILLNTLQFMMVAHNTLVITALPDTSTRHPPP